MKYEYLSNTPCEEAREQFISSLKTAGIDYKTSNIRVREANARVTACAVYAKRCSPHYCASAMDGIALMASATAGASESSPVTLPRDSYIFVDTGDPLPEGCDCVVMIEDVIEADNGEVKLYSASVPWCNVRQIGEDICMGDMIVPSFTEITPAIIGALLAGGVSEIQAVKPPLVAIIPTGDEIVDSECEPDEGDIPEFNSAIFSAMLENWGAESKIYPIIPDDPEKLKAAVLDAAASCDFIIVIAGSSAGRDDYTANILRETGKLLLHGLAVKPGKPAVLGNIGAIPFVGVPGYPVSGITVMEEIVKPVIELLTKRAVSAPAQMEAYVTKRLTSSLKYKEFLRCRAAKVNGKTVAVPMNRGAGIVTGFAKASGIIEIPQNSEGLEANSKVAVRLLKKANEIENCVCVTGSHDPLIDEIADILLRSCSPVNVVSSHVGSMGAITALRAGEAHMGGIHLLDAKSGEYNRSYVKKYFPDGGVTLVRGVKRKQGLMVAHGNPHSLYTIADIAKSGVSYVNRQRGSGTRILLDYLLERESISPDAVYGYTREEFTHTAVAAIIAAGSADAGLGIYSAAKTYSLGFIPLWDEEYDFLVLTDALGEISVQNFLNALKSDCLAERLFKMGGYTCDGAGEIISF